MPWWGIILIVIGSAIGGAVLDRLFFNTAYATLMAGYTSLQKDITSIKNNMPK